MKKLILTVLVLGSFSAFTQTATLSMPDLEGYTAGETVVMPIVVDDILSSGGTGGISGFLFSVYFDESVLEYVGTQNLHAGASNAYYSENLVATGSPYNWRGSWIDESGLTSFAVAPSDILIELVFTYNGPGGSDQTWSSSSLVSGGTAIEVMTEMTDENFTPYALTLNPGGVNLVTHIFLDLTVYLEGPYNSGGVMNTSLLAGGYIPVGQPYNPPLPYYGNSSPVWLYPGTESAAPVPANVVDWVLVQLRDADVAVNATSATILATQAGFLLDDGSVVDLDGTSNISFTGVDITNNLFAVIYHRNHLGIMSANAVTTTAGIYTYDFSSSVTQVYGGINGHKELESGVWGMVAADGNGNGLVQNTDEVNVWKVDLGGSGYQAGDFNLNGLTQNTDEVNYWKPNLGGGGQVPLTGNNNGYQSQIPE